MKRSFRDFVKEHHALYVLFWPFYFFLWYLTENLALGRAFTVHSALDDLIPFCELFAVFYVIWYPFWIGMMLYCFISEPETFRRMSRYFIMLFTICLLIYLVLPTAVELRPAVFERSNILTDLTAFIYKIDHPTNVCPSEHVIGAFSVVFAAFNTKRFRKAKWMIPIIIIAVLISLSILFIKQHSFWDLIAALPFCIAGWLVCFKPWERDVSAI